MAEVNSNTTRLILKAPDNSGTYTLVLDDSTKEGVIYFTIENKNIPHNNEWIEISNHIDLTNIDHRFVEYSEFVETYANACLLHFTFHDPTKINVERIVEMFPNSNVGVVNSTE